jgi:hypothetical protein
VLGDGNATAGPHDHQANQEPMASSTAPNALPNKTLDLDVASGRLAELLAQVGQSWR